MFFNKNVFNKVNGFDKNIFLYWEETDYTKRAKKKGYKAYQLNLVKVKHEKGKAVKTINSVEDEKLKIYIFGILFGQNFITLKNIIVFLASLYFFQLL